MEFGENLRQFAFIAMVAVAIGGIALALLLPFLTGGNAEKRVKSIAEGKRGSTTQPARQSMAAKFLDGQKDNRRKQVQDALKQIEAGA